MKIGALTIAILALGLAACNAERNDAAENDTTVANTAEGAAESLGNAAEDVGNAVENTAEDIADEAENATE